MASSRTHSSGVTPELLKAVAHPLRHRILLAFNEKVSSPSRVAAELGEPVGRVSHHVRVLAKLGAIEAVRTRHRRGAVEHFYRANLRVPLDDDPGKSLSVSTRGALEARGLRHPADDVRAAMAAGGFDHLRAHVSYTLLELDQDDLEAVSTVLADTAHRLSAARAAAGKRLERSGEEPIRTQLGILHFVRD